MRQFLRVAEGMDFFPLVQTLQRRGAELWNSDRVRQTFTDSPHAQVDDILMRFDTEYPQELGGDGFFDADTNIGTRDWREAWHVLPEARGIVLGLMARVGAYSLERVLITRLAPGGTIKAHADVLGAYAQLNDIARYHLVLQGLPGSLFHCGDETVQMLTGEVWWFNAREPHACENNSADDRIHMLVDVRLFP